MVKHTGLERDLLKQMCWQPIHNDGRVNLDTIVDYQNWAVKQGQLDKPATIEQFWDPSYIDYANKVLGSGGK